MPNLSTSPRSVSFRARLSDDRGWYVVYTKARQESVALENLSRQKFEVYCPCISVCKRDKSGLVRRIQPFFPRYIFLRLDFQADNCSLIRSTRGVSGLVRFDGVPKQVPASLIEALRHNEDNEKLQIVTPANWKQGDVVEIEQGPFSGYQCIYQAQKGADRVAVLLNIIGKQTRVTILENDLQVPRFA